MPEGTRFQVTFSPSTAEPTAHLQVQAPLHLRHGPGSAWRLSGAMLLGQKRSQEHTPRLVTCSNPHLQPLDQVKAMFDMIEQEKRREIEERRREEEYLRPGPCSRSSIQPRSRPHPQHMPSGAFTTLTSTAYTARLAVRKVSQKAISTQVRN